MRFVSTRGTGTSASLTDAIVTGMAPDGGLFVPEPLPEVSPDTFPDSASLPTIAAHLLQPFAAGDPLVAALASLCHEAFTFDAPVVPLEGTPGPASVLELFHGPTSAFKDFGARFLAECLAHIRRGSVRPLTILVATSGDTGGAVASAFHNRPGVQIVLLYPKGLVSSRQAHQLACWGGNVRTFAVLGSFDDCQHLAKEAFRDPDLTARLALSSANSINIGRLLPQMAYYASASLQLWRREGRKPGFIIPAGNLGNAVACVWAREMGLPIGDIVLATNANRTIADYLNGGPWQPRQSTPTLASAMDVGNPSNIERLRWLYGDDNRLRSRLSTVSVSDDEIRATIRGEAEATGYVWCPHGATAAYVYRTLARARADEHWVLVATAHPAKFDTIVEPLLGRPVPVPPPLARLLERPRQEQELPASIEALRTEL